MNLKIQYSFKLGGMAKMASAHIKREILAVLMESPFYFTIPPRERLEFLKFFSQQYPKDPVSSTVNRDCRMKVSPAFEASHYNSLILGEQLT
jgi:hypothetical protein